MRTDGRITKTWTDDDGKRHYVYGNTEREANMKLAKAILDFEEHRVVLDKHTTVKEWALQAVEVYKTSLKPITKKTYLARMNHTILDEIGSMQLCKVKAIHCQRVLNNQMGNSKWQIAEVNRMLYFIFEKAVENELLNVNPAAHLVKPSGTKSNRRAITEREREAFYKALEKNEKLMPFRFMLECGCRPGEAFAIKGNDFKMIDGNPMLHIRGTKTEQSDRYVPCPMDLFEKYKGKRFDLCFTTSTGHEIDENVRKYLYKRLYRDMNIAMGCKMYRNELLKPYPLSDDFEPYMFRHTYCTDLARRDDIDMLELQKLMGHSDLKMISQVYAHIETEDIVKVASKILASS